MKGNCFIDKNSRIVKIDESGKHLLSCDNGELLGKSFLEVVKNICFINQNGFSDTEVTWDHNIFSKNKFQFVFSNNKNKTVKAICSPFRLEGITNQNDIAFKLSLQSNKSSILHFLQPEQSLSYKIIHLINVSQDLSTFLRKFILLIKDFSGIEAVAIRLKSGCDFPYYISEGFDPKFIAQEKFLLNQKKSNESFFHINPLPNLECLCGAVISGETSCDFNFFTEGGSFWTNSNSQFVKTDELNNVKFKTRNRCNEVGYESVALIPIKNGKTTYGLIQLCDHRIALFSEHFITQLERLAEIIGTGLIIKDREKTLEKTTKTLNEKNKLLEGFSQFLKTLYREDLSEETKFRNIVEILGGLSTPTEDINIYLTYHNRHFSLNNNLDYKNCLTKKIITFGIEVGKIEYFLSDEISNESGNGYINSLDNFLDSIIIELETYLEKQQIELAKQRTELFLYSVWEHSGEGMRLSNKDGTIIAVNDAFCQLVEAEMSDMVGRSINSLYINQNESDIFESLPKILDDCLIETPPNRCQSRVTFFTNKTLFLDVSYSVIVCDDGEKLMLTIFRDNTQFVLAQEELIKNETLAAVGKLSTFLTHEIRSYLNPIKMNIDLIEKKIKLPSLEMKHFLQVKNQLNRMGHLLKEVMQLSKISNVDYSSFNMSQLIDNLIFFFKPTLIQKDITTWNRINTSITVEGDFEKIQAVFIHLIENSIDAINSDGVIEFSSTTDNVKNILNIYMRDTGCGINDSIKIFEPFYTTKNTGTGIGLSLVTKYLKMHNASIELNSAEPANTIFLITFPKFGVCNGNNLNN